MIQRDKRREARGGNQEAHGERRRGACEHSYRQEASIESGEMEASMCM